MPVDPLGFARVTHRFTSPDGSWGSGYELFITGVPLQADLDDLAAAIDNKWFAVGQGFFGTPVVFDGVTVRYSDGTSETDGTSTNGDTGTGTTHTLPLSVAIVSSRRISSVYRGGKPRTYWSGMPTDSVDTDRTFSATFVAEFETAWSELLDYIAGYTATNISSVSVGVIHRYSGGVLLTPPTFEPFVGTKVQRRVCSQRRRLGALL